MATNSIKQPFPIAPGDAEEVFWDWTKRLPQGVAIASFTLDPVPGLTVLQSGRTGAIVRAVVEVDEAALVGGVPDVLCTITTDQAPPRRRSKAIKFSIVGRP